MASAWGSWSTGRKIIGVWKVKHPWSVQSLGYRGWGMGDGDAAGVPVVLLKGQVTSPHCPICSMSFSRRNPLVWAVSLARG